MQYVAPSCVTTGRQQCSFSRFTWVRHRRPTFEKNENTLQRLVKLNGNRTISKVKVMYKPAKPCLILVDECTTYCKKKKWLPMQFNTTQEELLL